MDTQTIQRRRWVILGVVVVGLLAIVIDNTVLNVALKTIASPPAKGGIDASQSELEWAINSYTLVFAGLLFTFGVVGDRIGRKRVLMAGLVLFGLGSLFSAYSHSPDTLIAARAVMGLGGAAVMPQTLSIIANVFEPAERPRAIGIWTSAVGIGVAIGPVLGGLLLTHFWWGSVFLIPESRNPAPGKIDYAGVLASVLGLVLLVYGIVQGGDGASWLSAGVLGPVLGGLAVLALFAWYETRIEHPSLDVRLFKNRNLSASVGSIALLFFVQGAGLGLAVPAATSSVMEVLPRERAGAGSALTNTARQVAVALSVAVLGSILSQVYRSSLDPTLSALPASARNAAGSSITATQAVAAQLGHAGEFLLAPAGSAFVDAMRVTTAIAAALAVVGGVALLRWMPGRERPTIEELVAAEVAAAERDLEAGQLPGRPELSER